MERLVRYVENKTVLIIGQGSIGQRHARLLREAGANTFIVSRHLENAFRSIAEALKYNLYDYCVVCNETNRHIDAISELNSKGFKGILLVEKPISSKLSDTKRIYQDLASFKKIAIAYNLRFHPLIEKLRQLISGKRILTVEMHVGQHLATWRNSLDFRKDSSALLSAGGGVIRDLSHEMDLAVHLFGMPERIVATGGNLGALEIETDEAWTLLLGHSNHGPVSIHMNYFDSPPRRFIHINTQEGTIHADFIGGKLLTGGTVEEITCERDYTYQAMHCAVLDDRNEIYCSAQEAMATLHLIEAAEESQSKGKWIKI